MPMFRRSVEEQEDRDLGFGSLGSARGARLVQRDGSFSVTRVGRDWRAALSLYHTLLTTSWTKFLGLAAAIYLVFNLLFALAYWSCGPAAISGPALGDPLFRAFAFAVQTSSTIGYGQLAPVSTAVNVVVIVQAFLSLVLVALGTGMVFARFSRPRADFAWSHHAVVAPYRGITGFMLRIAHRRENHLVDLRARVIFGIFDEGEAADRRRQFHTLELERDGVSFLPTSWTLVHPIEKDSPLAGLDREQLCARQAEIIVLLRGHDATTSQAIYDWSSYAAEDISFGERFARIYEDEGEPTGVRMDINRIDETEPAPLEPSEPG